MLAIEPESLEEQAVLLITKSFLQPLFHFKDLVLCFRLCVCVFVWGMCSSVQFPKEVTDPCEGLEEQEAF